MNISFLFAGALCCLTALASEPFATMDTKGESPDKFGKPLVYGHDTFDFEKRFPRLPLTDREKKTGVRVTFTDLNRNRGNEFIFNEPQLKQEWNPVAPQNDYVAGAILVYLLKPVENLNISIRPLVNGKGQMLKKENIRILTAVPKKHNPRYKEMLMEPRLSNLKKNELIELVVMINVPKSTAGGVYRGSMNIGGTELAVNLRVADFSLPLKHQAGFYICGELYKPGPKTIQQNGFTEENLDRYFSFLKSRRLNSLTVYDFLPELHYINGKITGTFSSVSKIAASMKKNGCDGKLIVDLRSVTYFCNAVAERLEKLKREGKPVPTGDLGLTIKNGKSRQTPYSERAKSLFEEALHLVVKISREEQWPKTVLIVEEEIGNNYPVKLAGYESFMPVLMKTYPELAGVVDNGIGYGRKNAVDYGARDKAPHRQYNSWEEGALETAEKDGAEIWTFNADPSRLAFGFLQLRLNSKGNHQWADLWDSWNYQWQYSRLSGKGVVSSIPIERMHEGLIDGAAGEVLRELCAELRKNGQLKQAEKGERVLKELTRDIPVRGDSFRGYGAIVSDANLDARRWKLFATISELSGKQSGKNSVDGTASPEIKIHPTVYRHAVRQDYTLVLKQFDGKIEPNADVTEKFWGRWIGPLRFLTEKEAALRARASTEEEFKRLNQASYSVINMAALPDGLAIFSTANNVRPQAPYRFEHKDDDTDMWKDDCYEFFFGLPDKKVCRLIFNSAGAKTFEYDSEIVPASGIRSYIRHPVNASGGTNVKLLVPWRYFKLDAPPASGSVWEFNVGREFHTHNSILSWAPLASSFREREKWGRIVFGGGTVKRESKLSIYSPVPNFVMNGTHAVFMTEVTNLKPEGLKVDISLVSETGKTVKLPIQTIKSANSEVFLNTSGLAPGNWRLILAYRNAKAEAHFTVAPPSK